jgi:hypothetical protein
MATQTEQPPSSGPGGRIAGTLPTDPAVDPIVSPSSPSSPEALARFEFEAGRGNEGTKILMVEWGASELAPSAADQEDWEVSWEGKTATFPLTEVDEEGIRRVYFFIPPNASIPPLVTITQRHTGRRLTTKAMPAIFAPGLGVDGRDAGRRGVLHSLWAKKRLAQLQEEIRKELVDNSEGVALEMAVQERQWILEHFGLADPVMAEAPPPPPAVAPQPSSPQSPRSPVAGRLGEKLKGLKLATSPSELSTTQGKLPTRLHPEPCPAASA